jgi:hypothetical protein
LSVSAGGASIDVYTKTEGHIMSKILSRISGPLLIGSILALGALAWPGQASAADGPRFIFRASAGLVSPPTLVADNGSTGETGETGGTGDAGDDDTAGDGDTARGDEGGAGDGSPWFVAEYGEGWKFECPTTWDQATLETYRELLETEAVGTWTPGTGFVYQSARPASAFLAPESSQVFDAFHSLFGLTYTSDGETVVLGNSKMSGDPRPWPSNPSGNPLPCSWETIPPDAMTVGNTSGAPRELAVLNFSIVFR